MPPSEEMKEKEKALVQEKQTSAKGVRASKNDGTSTSLKPSVQGKSRMSDDPLKPIKEGVPTPDDIRTQHMTEEESMRNPLEIFPLFLVEDGLNGPAFNEHLHHCKLAFFGTSPYEGE